MTERHVGPLLTEWSWSNQSVSVAGDWGGGGGGVALLVVVVALVTAGVGLLAVRCAWFDVEELPPYFQV